MAKKTEMKKGKDVAWKWGTGTGHGTVAKVHTDDVEKKIRGTKIKRKASPAKPAIEVKTDKGGEVLKSASEVKVT